MTRRRVWFDCACDLPGHAIRFVYDAPTPGWNPEKGDWGGPEMEVSVQFFREPSPWKRLVFATRYVLGLAPPIYPFDVTMLKASDVGELRALCDLFLEAKK